MTDVDNTAANDTSSLPVETKEKVASAASKKFPAWALPLAGIVALLLVVLYQGGVFDAGKINPGKIDLRKESTIHMEKYTIAAKEVPLVYRAVGTVRSRNEIEINPQITARILRVSVRSGDAVQKGDILVELDDKDLAAQTAQAEQRVEAAKAARAAAEEGVDLAKSALDLAGQEMARTQVLYDKGILPKQQLEQTINVLRQAQASYNQANQRKRGASAELSGSGQALKQAEVTLGYATIKSPMDGIIGERLADPGDLATPGKILMRMFDPTRLMLETPVRESLATVVRVGRKVIFTVPALEKSFTGDVREVVPAVDPTTRTFLIKVFIGKAKDLMSGMYGTLSLPLEKTENVIIIPERAIRRTGQIESVIALVAGKEHRIFVRSSPSTPGLRRIISGLEKDMTILLPEAKE